MKKLISIFVSISIVFMSCSTPSNPINDEIENNFSSNDVSENNPISNEDKEETDSSENESYKEKEDEESVPTIEVFTVTFNSNGGTSISSQEIEKGKTIQIPQNPLKDNYNFLGWFINDTMFDFSTPITSNINLNAKWDKVYFSITFDSNGGTDVDSLLINKYGYIKEPTKPTKESYRFIGWFIDDVKFDFESTQITKDITLKAKWNPLFTVTFETNGGTSVSTQTVEYGNKCIEPTIPTKEKNTFAYWYCDDENTEYNFDTELNDNIILKAKWYNYSCYVGSDYHAIDLTYYVNGEKMNWKNGPNDDSVGINNYLYAQTKDGDVIITKRLPKHNSIIKEVFATNTDVFIIYE